MPPFSPSPFLAARLTHDGQVLRLRSLGMLLDAMDQGEVPVAPHQYTAAAVEALQLVRAGRLDADIRRTCSRSKALTELLQNAMLEEAHAGGYVTWAWQPPAAR